jgi:outer membrane lipoprotein-sorting protein
MPLPTALLTILLAASAGVKDASACERVHKALENVVTTPAHVYTKETSSQRGTTETETIYLDGKVYFLAARSGRWTLSPTSARELVEAQRRSREHAMLSCKPAGEDRVGDRLAVVYTTSRSTAESKADSRLWIDKASGLLLRQEEDLSAGENNTVHRSVRYEYGNVAAPKLPD